MLQDAKLEHDKTLLQRQIEATDAAIDKLVYELYGLTEEEMAILEATGKKFPLPNKNTITRKNTLCAQSMHRQRAGGYYERKIIAGGFSGIKKDHCHYRTIYRS